jgi:hypothetical protein
VNSASKRVFNFFETCVCVPLFGRRTISLSLCGAALGLETRSPKQPDQESPDLSHKANKQHRPKRDLLACAIELINALSESIEIRLVSHIVVSQTSSARPIDVANGATKCPVNAKHILRKTRPQ